MSDRAAGAGGGRWIGRTLVLAVWFGMSAGLAEVILFGVKYGILHKMVPVSRDVIWMAPLADILFCLIAAGLLLLVAVRVERLRSLQVAATVTAFPAVFTIILHYQPIHIAAKLILAMGVAVVAGRIVAGMPRLAGSIIGWTTLSIRREDRAGPSPADLPAVDRRRFIVAAATSMVALTAGTRGFLRAREWDRLRSLPEPVPGSPNVLFIVLDTVRARSLGLYGYERDTTPELERWAAKGVTFDHAYSTAPWTLPSHASMFTGRWHHEMSADWETPLDDTFPTLAEFLAARGYATAGFTANPAYTTWESGLDRGFARYDDYLQSPTQVLGSSSLGILIGCGTRNEIGCRLRKPLGWYELLGRKHADGVRREFTEWVDDRADDRPFFAFLNFFDAHVPYLPPSPWDSRFGAPLPRGNPMHLDLPGWEWTADQVQAERLAYDGAIAWIDSQVGGLLDDLEERGLLDNTIVIITSDHGEEFMEHGVMTHANSLYVPALHVPLVVIGGSRVPAGVRVEAPVSVRDVARTVCDLAGFDNAPFPGTPLAAYWSEHVPDPEPFYARVSGRSFRPESYPVSRGDLNSVMEGSYHYIRRGDGETELYDLRTDPWERDDRMSRDRAIADSLRVLLDRVLGLPE